MPPIDQPRSYVRGRARAEASKPKRVYGPPAPKRKPVYGPPAPKKVYGPPAPKARKKVVAGPPAPKSKPKHRVYSPRALDTHASDKAVERYKRSAHYLALLDEARKARPTTSQRSGPFTKDPLRGMLDAERRAIGALADLRAQDPEKYDRALEKGGLKDRAIAGPRGQTIEHYKGRSTGEALSDFSRPAPRKHDILVAGPRGQTRPTRQSAITGGELLASAGRNAPKDAAELLVTMPTSLAHLAKTAITDPEKVPGMLAEPYIKILKDPQKEFSERPVSTTLALLPIGRVPGRIGGRVARRAGKQTLARPDATLPGTALTEKRAGSRDVLRRGDQARQDRGRPAPVMTDKEVRRRVDEFRDFAQHHVARAEGDAGREAKQRNLNADAGRAHVKQARERAHREVDERFAREFGAVARPAVGAAEKHATRTVRTRAEQRRTITRRQLDAARAEVKSAVSAARIARDRGRPGVPPRQATRLLDAIDARDQAREVHAAARGEERAARAQHVDVKQQAAQAPLIAPQAQGRLYAAKPDANKVAQRLNEGLPEDEPAFVVRPAGDRYAVVPAVAAERLVKHQVVGSSPATGAKVLRRSRQAFTQAVLPLSAKWLAGQGVEAGIRSVVAGAGPLDLLRAKRVVKTMNEHTPGSGDELLTRLTGGQFGLTGAAREFANGKSLAEEFSDTGLARPAAALTRAGGVAPARLVRRGWNAYTEAVMGSINGAIENNARLAMAGQAIKGGPLLERRLLGLTDKAVEDAARGLQGTEAQVQLARAVDRMYGRYSKFSPEQRSFLLHWTPFLPWFVNAATFLLKVLPVDHPMTASLLAATSTTTEEWRKQHGLSLHGDKQTEDRFLGSYPTGDGRYSRIGHFTPWGIGADPTTAVASLGVPQFFGGALNLLGDDFTGHRLKHPGYKGEEFNQSEKLARALTTIVEAQVPGVSQVGRLSGLTARHIDKRENVPPLAERLKRELPGYPAKPTRKKPARKRPAGGGSLGFGSGSSGGGDTLGF